MPVMSTIDQTQHVWLSHIDYVKPELKVSLCDKAPVQTEKKCSFHYAIIFSFTLKIHMDLFRLGCST